MIPVPRLSVIRQAGDSHVFGAGRETTAVNIFLRRNPQVDKRFRAAFPGFLER